MAELNMNIPHSLSQEEALTRIKKLLSKLKDEHGDKIQNVREDWEGEKGIFEFTAKGFNLSGNLHVNESSVDIKAHLPFAVSLFKGTIKRIIEEEAGKLLSDK